MRLDEFVECCWLICDDGWDFRLTSDQWWKITATCEHLSFTMSTPGNLHVEDTLGRLFVKISDIMRRKMVKSYVKNPDPIQADQVTTANMKELANWCGGEIRQRTDAKSLDDAYDQVLVVPTLSGLLQVGVGDYLVRYENGKFDSLPASFFKENYTEAPPAVNLHPGVFAKGVLARGHINTSGGIQPKGWGANSDSP